MKLEGINIAEGFCAKKSQRIPELHRNNSDSQPFRYRVPLGDFLLPLRTTEFQKKCIYSN